MADFGSGVSRTLSPLERAFKSVVWQKGKPPLDSELNLMGQVAWEQLAETVRQQMTSGFFLDPTRALNDFQFNQNWSNYFILGNPRTVVGTREAAEQEPVVWANVNGWIIPVAGTDNTVVGDVRNLIKLYPAPTSDTRTDFIFLEVWQGLVDPNPSTVNKPSLSTVWKYGNVKYGGTNITDDLEDPAIGVETTKRLQTQYRLRVFGSGLGLGQSVTLDVYPEGLDDTNILGQGAASVPIGGFQWTNMRETLGDPGLWRAGDGNPNNDLKTFDGYTYAVPVCAVFRRNDNVYVSVSSSGNPNQNGAFSRTPGTGLLSDPLTGAKALTTPTITAALAPATGVAAAATINVGGLSGSGLDDSNHVLSSVFLKIGDEIIGVSAVDTVAGTITIPLGGRGRYGTAAVGHAAGASIRFFNSRPDGRFADEISEDDVLDLRRGINATDWDFNRLLAHNVAALAKGELRTSFKKSGAGDTEGVSVHEVDYLHADGSITNPNHTEALDGPDGIRTVFSDGAAIQSDVTVLLDNDATLDANGVGLTTSTQFDSTVNWDVGADFKPVGFLNLGTGGPTNHFTNGSSILLFLGGADGGMGARGTFRAATERAVRALMPREYWKSGYPTVDANNGNQYPISLRFLGQRSQEAAPVDLSATFRARHPGPMYPDRETNFERPFIVLGGLLRSTLKIAGLAATELTTAGGVSEIDVGINFDTAGSYFSKDTNGNFNNDPTLVTAPLLRAQKTLFGMLTDNGRDRTGNSSEVYVVVYGDEGDDENNGAFKILGAGTAASGYTNHAASNATSLVVQALSADFTAFNSGTGNSVTVEFRSQHHNSEDTSDYAARTADLAIVLTDIGGLATHPWNAVSLGSVAGDGYNLSLPIDGGSGKVAVAAKALVSLSLQYHPGRGGFARVPEEVVRFASRTGSGATVGAYLRQNPALRDTTFAANSGMPSTELSWPLTHVQTWNRLPGLGWHAPDAPNYGGNVVGFTEQDRESELFFDKGSKTLIFRPFRDRQMTLQANTFTQLPAGKALFGDYNYAAGAVPKDGLQILTGAGPGDGKQMGFAVPREFMPRFGRQDIPYWVDTDAGQGPYLPGINHLFKDQTDQTRPVFHVIGGEANLTGGNQVKPMFFTTDTPLNYGASATVISTINNKPNYLGRKTTDIDATASAAAANIVADLAAVNSSDFGRGLKGIQLPPFIGIARLQGVYERADYIAKGGRTFAANRYALDSDPATNLLREDTDQQSLFILKDGGQDVTTELDDHTYIIPSNVLDIQRVPTATASSQFEDFDYVVEGVVFVFAKGFINKNNFVLVRKFGGDGLSVANLGAGNVDGDDPQIEGVHMVIPAPANSNEQVYVAYNRTPYQGDTYMTRNGSTRTITDYEHRYGQLSVTAQNALKTPIQQYDPNGAFVIETPNARGFEVLASMDFYTTLGTGKVGGTMYPGTPLDVGFTEPAGNRRLPLATDPAWRVLPRAFSEGQLTNPSRARLNIEFLDNSLLDTGDATGEHTILQVGLLDGTILDMYASKAGNVGGLIGTGVPAADIWTVDEVGDPTHLVVNNAPLGFGIVTPGQIPAPVTVTVTGAAVGDSVVLNLRANPNNIVYRARVTAPDTVTVEAFQIADNIPFAALADPDNGVQGITISNPGGGIPANSSVNLAAVALTGATVGDVVAINPPSDLEAGLVVTGRVSGAGLVVFTLHNVTTGLINLAAPRTLLVASLRQFPTGLLADPSVNADVRVIQTGGEARTSASSLATFINAHALLQSTMKAYAVGDDQVQLESVPSGTEGNGITISARHMDNPTTRIENVLRLSVPFHNGRPVGANVTSSPLQGGVDLLVNAGNGTSQLKLTGMTERLPLGVLLQDSDFLSENPLGDDATAMNSSPAGPRPIQTLIPLTDNGDEFDRFLGEPGELLAMADGSISTTGFAAYTTATPTGAKSFRLYRGGGSAFVLSGDNPGGPIDWVSETFPASITPMLKGGVLACRAMLVRNFYEEAFAAGGPYTLTEGDEIQMVILTHGLLGNGNTRDQGITMDGIISPTGYGEGYAAADRYRIEGRPSFKGFSREIPDPSNVTLAVFPDTTRS